MAWNHEYRALEPGPRAILTPNGFTMTSMTTPERKGLLGFLMRLYDALDWSRRFAMNMIFLLIFIVQNSDPVQVQYFGLQGTLPLGVAMLFAAIAGALTAALLGTVRILQLRARARRAAAR